MIFSDRQYPVNIKNSKTFIYPANSLSLGDDILMTMISQAVFRDNPDEAVSLVPFSEDIVRLSRQEQPGKVFLRKDVTCVTGNEVGRLKKLTEVIPFELHRECHALWKEGMYPTFEGSSDQFSLQEIVSKCWQLGVNGLADKRYVVFHIRNIQKIRTKNTDPELVEKIMGELVRWATSQSVNRFIVLLGNDDSYGTRVEYLNWDLVIDLRHKLLLKEIHQVIRQADLFIGSDSGIAHLAGCCDVPMVSWGFVDECWFPKVRNFEKCLFLTREESNMEMILKEIRKRLAV